jgi:3-deoxy-manno-octulosonate cytidylyltransferase (CMP-KDO synthetase)
MKFVGIIPARFASSRLPGKALQLIGNKPMIVHVLERVKSSLLGGDVYVATDDLRIKEAVEAAGGAAILTSPDHPSGTDRCHEAINSLDESFDFVLNIQGDEPFIDPEEINQLVKHCTSETEIATLVQPVQSNEDLFNPNVVKVVQGVDRQALYFSRSAIPYNRNASDKDWLSDMEYWKHIGMYAYRTDILEKIHTLPAGTLEKSESLEQLRWLEHGLRISVFTSTGTPSIGIDTPDDLEKARFLWNEQNNDTDKQV